MERGETSPEIFVTELLLKTAHGVREENSNPKIALAAAKYEASLEKKLKRLQSKQLAA